MAGILIPRHNYQAQNDLKLFLIIRCRLVSEYKMGRASAMLALALSAFKSLTKRQ